MRLGRNAVTVYICTARRLRYDVIFIDLEINSNFVHILYQFVPLGARRVSDDLVS